MKKCTNGMCEVRGFLPSRSIIIISVVELMLYFFRIIVRRALF